VYSQRSVHDDAYLKQCKNIRVSVTAFAGVHSFCICGKAAVSSYDVQYSVSCNEIVAMCKTVVPDCCVMHAHLLVQAGRLHCKGCSGTW
jgi:hypothetical protein